MRLHILGMTLTVVVLTFLTLLPFLPGRYDRLSVPTSAAVQVLGWSGLLFAPLGIAWGFDERSGRIKRLRSLIRAGIVLVSLCVLGAVTLAATSFSGFIMGASMLVIGGLAIRRIVRLPSSINEEGAKRYAFPLWLVIPPLMTLLLQQGSLGRATEFSIRRAIAFSAPLIADIEAYKASRGHYPRSLRSVWSDYAPSVIGIDRFHYEPSGDSYSLSFEQFTSILDTRVFIIYNPLGEHRLPAHDSDILRYASHELERRQGYYAAHDLVGYPHWRCFHFD